VDWGDTGTGVAPANYLGPFSFILSSITVDLASTALPGCHGNPGSLYCFCLSVIHLFFSHLSCGFLSPCSGLLPRGRALCFWEGP
jgi:hypothetical protein